MLARSQRAVVAESTAEKRSIKWTAEGTMNRRQAAESRFWKISAHAILSYLSIP